ncbi:MULTISPECIES: LysE family translocator [unclassified Thalassotalea]|uniref:LysE family translocator n=1 Tax=unclassified Thalassotalea TaxID=2614972 RepID=UPI001081F7AF|nr:MULTISPECIES: LysE family translocator [unclassified Thalassotalea]NMP15621.1 LysE family translocator [Thalassotalea sp. Y01]QBY05733.1 LysE family translocator [Thalassotalea sp. HSM 43]
MEFFLPILIFAFSSTITPGPNNIMIMTSGLNFGIRRSLAHLFGICLGFPSMVVLVGLGFGVIFEHFPMLHMAIKVIGIMYLLYLAYLIANAGTQQQGETKSQPLTFIQAVLFQWVNPKAWVMATGAIAAFTQLDGHLFSQVLLVALGFFLVAFPCVGSWLYFGVLMNKIINNPKSVRYFNLTMALLLVVSILPVVAELIP